MSADISDPRLIRLSVAYETLHPARLDDLVSLYSEQAVFKDPFNEVRGRRAIKGVFSHMFKQIKEPRFTVLEGASNGYRGFLLWELRFLRDSGQTMAICGTSYLEYAPDGLVLVHRDYWDPVEEIFAKLPVLGSVARFLQKKLSASN
ncbi:nuclear transport factor 2 family protein [Ottowia thiooxydans]|uniref:nuclear transport factor 2 family protein n=1 Tax=Ottowia thiooxydans TaxID=219182 RepID=UPI00041DB04A|nr:nuclear transport factor 2 family protein [Ottowia thiooxydans]